MPPSATSSLPINLDALCAAEAQRLRTLRAQIVVSHPFWATLLLPMHVELNLAIPTFGATDCINRIWINPLWTSHLPTLKQLGYILLHEVAHVTLLHALRRGTRHSHRWNEAADYVINALLDEVTDDAGNPLYTRPHGIRVPGLGTFSLLYDEAFKGLSTDAVYAQLEDQPQATCPLCGNHHDLGPQPAPPPSPPQNGTPSNTTQGSASPAATPTDPLSPRTRFSDSAAGGTARPGADTHRKKPSSRTPSADPYQGDLFDNTPHTGDRTTNDASDPAAATPQSNGSSGDHTHQPPCPKAPDFHGHCTPGRTCLQLPPPIGDLQAQELVDRLIRAHETWLASNQRGSLPTGLTRFLRHLREAKVPWQRVLHTYAGQALLKEDFSLSPPHRRWLQYDIIRPSLRSEGIAQLVITLDTSGSTRPILGDFAAEIPKLYSLTEETLILTCDAAIHQVVKTKDVPAFLNRLAFEGGGGTSHRPIFQWLKDHHVQPDLLVALTDLHSQYPEEAPPYPVLWVTKEDHGTAPRWPRSHVLVIPSKAGDPLEQLAA